MYLRDLNLKEKKNFLELAYFVANYNQKFADEQKQLINEYRAEMFLSQDEYEIKGKEINEILDFFKDDSTQTKNAIFLEIMSLILSDDIYDEKEREVVAMIEDKFEITKEEHDEAVSILEGINDIYRRAEKFINT